MTPTPDNPPTPAMSKPDQLKWLMELPEGCLYAACGVQWLPLVGQFIDCYLSISKFDAFGFWIVPVVGGGVEIFATDGHSGICVLDPTGLANTPVFVRPTPELMAAVKSDTRVLPFDENHEELQRSRARPHRLILSRTKSVAHPGHAYHHVMVEADDCADEPAAGFFSQFLADPRCEHCGDKAYRDSIVGFEPVPLPVDFRSKFLEPTEQVERLCVDMRLIERLGFLMRHHDEEIAPAQLSFHANGLIVVTHDLPGGARIQMAIMRMLPDTFDRRRAELAGDGIEALHNGGQGGHEVQANEGTR